MSGLIIPEPHASKLKEAFHKARVIKGKDIMLKMKRSILAWEKLLVELKDKEK